MERQIIKIDDDKCTGCGLCVPNCHEGALQIIDGKARLISDLFCDGLGACIGHCPEGAITVETREAEPYDEVKTMKENILPNGKGTILAHLNHLKDHGADEFLEQALDTLRNSDLANKHDIMQSYLGSEEKEEAGCASGGCPGSIARVFQQKTAEISKPGDTPSALTQWPVQMHLINPASPAFKKSDLLLAADCTSFALGGFHGKLLSGKSLGIACPKLDQGLDVYKDKLVALIDQAEINTLTVAIMEVPCCGGLLRLAQAAVNEAERKIPVKMILVSIKGEILKEEWI